MATVSLCYTPLLASAFKNPKYPVFVLHGGDHYTLLVGVSCGDGVSIDPVFRPVRRSITCSSGEAAKVPFFVHWNGLPPAGPRLCVLQLSDKASEKSPTGEKNKKQRAREEQFSEQRGLVLAVGEVAEVVQADKEAENAIADRIETWLFEVALRIDSPQNPVPKKKDGSIDFKGRDLQKDVVDVRSLGETPPWNRKNIWRCRACYETRFTTMCFGQNELASGAGSENSCVQCCHCEKSATETGWTLFLTYQELPRRVQRQMQLRYGPKIATVLANRWEMPKDEDGDLISVWCGDLLLGDEDGKISGEERKKLYWPNV